MENDHIYLDTSIYNDSGSLTPANIAITRASPIIQIANEYDMTVARFDINCRNVPAILYTSNFRVSFVYNLNQYNAILVAPVNEYNPGWYQRPHDFILAVDQAFTTCHTLLAVAEPALGLVIAPAMYITDNDTINIVFEQKYIDALTIKVYFSSALNDKIDGFPLVMDSLATISSIGNQLAYITNSVLNSSNIGLPIRFTAITTKLYRYLNYSFNFTTLNDIRSIFITSNLPIINENVINVGSGDQQGISRKSENRITDFLFFPSQPYDTRNRIVYIPTIYRMISMTGTETLTNINLTVFFETYDKQAYLLKLIPNTSLSIKLLFRKKLFLK